MTWIDGLGSQVRRLRRQRGMTLQQVAEGAGLSPAMISKVENGNGNPSITTVVHIARALGVPTALLFAHEVHDDESVKVNQKQVYTYSGVAYTVVASPVTGMRLVVVDAEPGAERGSPLFPHSPHEGYEQGIVLEGEMELTINGAVHTLRARETISFPSRLVHSWRNAGSVPMRAAWTISVLEDEFAAKLG